MAGHFEGFAIKGGQCADRPCPNRKARIRLSRQSAILPEKYDRPQSGQTRKAAAGQECRQKAFYIPACLAILN